jgi:hypothetical protein
MKIIKFKNISGLSLGLMSSMLPVMAQAQTSTTTFGSMAGTYATQINSVAHLLIIVAFLAGLGLVFFGLMKLKKASDSAGRDSYMPGIVSIAIGGLAVGLPALLGVGYATMFNGSGTNSGPQEGSVNIN